MAYPDAVDLIQAYLAGLHAGVTVATRVPATRPASWIQLRAVGGAWKPPVRDESRIDVFCWAATEPAAWTLGETVRREIHSLAATSTLGVVCYGVDEVMSPRMFDDPITENTYARWATYTIVLRADQAVRY